MIRKALLTTLFSAFIYYSVYAQVAPAKSVNIYYLDKAGNLALDSANLNCIRVITKDSTNEDSYIVEDFYLNKRRKLVGRSTVPYYSLRREGIFIEYFPNGRRKNVKYYHNNTIEGDEQYYYPNGKPYFTGHYDQSQHQYLITTSKDSVGTSLASDSNGSHIEYDDDFILIKGQGPIVNGLKNGVWKGSYNDTVSYTCNYNMGKSISGTSVTKAGNVYHFTDDNVAPEFPGGSQVFGMFLAHQMHYPASAKENNVQGKVFINFTVDRKGKLRDLKIVRGIGSGCDEEVIRVLKLSPDWTPGKVYGIPVDISYTIPISFALQNAGY